MEDGSGVRTHQRCHLRWTAPVCNVQATAIGALLAILLLVGIHAVAYCYSGVECVKLCSRVGVLDV